MSTERIVWWFGGDKLRDGSPIPPPGEQFPHRTDPRPCEHGWHGSERLIDALTYANGTNLGQRLLTGTVIPHGSPVDKYCASDGYYLTPCVDVRDVLVAWSRRVALHAIRVTAADALRATKIPVLIDHAEKLVALSDDCDLCAASDASYAARDAAHDARYVARDAASDALYAAIDAALYAASAARDAAIAARYAAIDARYAAIDARYNEWLEEMVRK